MESINFHISTPSDWLQSGHLKEHKSLSNNFNMTDCASELIKFAQANYHSEEDDIILTNAEGLEIPSYAPWTVKHIINDMPNNQRELFIVRAREGKRLCHEESNSNIEEEVCNEARDNHGDDDDDKMKASENSSYEDEEPEQPRDIPYDMVVESPNGHPVWAIHFVSTIDVWSTLPKWQETLEKSSKYVVTYGNCGVCFSSGPLGSICPRCTNTKNFTPDLEIKQVRFAMLYIEDWNDPPAQDNYFLHHQVKSIVDAGQFARAMRESHLFTKDFKSKEVCQEVWPPVEPKWFRANANRTVFWTNSTPCERLFNDEDMLNKLYKHSDLGNGIGNIGTIHYLRDFTSIQNRTLEKILELRRHNTKRRQEIIDEQEAYIREQEAYITAEKERIRNARQGEL
jgi:hypothetical protein